MHRSMPTSNRFRRSWALILSILLFSSHFSDLFGSVIRVPVDVATIQGGIDAAQIGDTVIVAGGTYTGTGNRDLDFLGKQIVVKSIAGPTATTIDCQGTNLDPHRAFYFHSGEDSNSVVRGFTITNGYASIVQEYWEIGGGILCLGASPQIVDCQFISNLGTNGAGVFCRSSDARIDSCLFTLNDQGALGCDSGAPRVTGCVFYENGSSNVPYQIFLGTPSAPVFTNCTIIGDAFYCNGSNPVIKNSIIAWSQYYSAFECPGDPCQPTFFCTDIYGCAGGDWIGCIAGQGSVNGNFSSAPSFCNVQNHDYTVSSASPCAPANNSCSVLIGAKGIACYPGGRVWHVKADGSGDAPTIQAAIDSSAAGDTVLVASGAFSGYGNRDLDLGGKAIVVRSEHGMDSTVILCQGSLSTPRRGFYIHFGEGAGTVIDGFTIQGGFAEKGGAIYCGNSSPTIANCHFKQNSTLASTAGYQGGGIYCTNSSPVISNCLFTGNGLGDGAAIYCQSSSPQITNCTMTGNPSDFGVVSFAEGSSPTLARCIITIVNSSAITCDALSSFTLTCSDVIPDRRDFSGDSATNRIGIDGNFSLNPRFCRADAGDYRLMDDSPCAAGQNSCGVLIGALGVGCSPQNRTWLVNPDGSGQAPTIQAAIDSAIHGDTVIVADGVFTGVGNRNIEFRGKAIVLKSQHGAAQSVIDCQGTVDNPRRGFYFGGCEDFTSIVEDITIAGGFGLPDHSAYLAPCGGGMYCFLSSPRISNCVFRGNTGGSYGGGIYAEGTSLKILSCAFDSNSASTGGGVNLAGSSATIIGCTFMGNSDAGLVGVSRNGPIRVANCQFQSNIGWAADLSGDSVMVTDCSFLNNNGGLALEWGKINVNNCIFKNQTSYGVMISGYKSPQSASQAFVSNSVFVSNQLGVHGSFAIVNLSGCTFALNQSAVLEQGALLNLDHCLVTFSTFGPAVDAQYYMPQMNCCDLFGNAGGDWIGGFAGQLGIKGNISADPLFCDTVAGDFGLTPASPCAPENNTCVSLIGALDVGCVPAYICGDANGDGAVDISDAVFLIGYIFSNGPAPDPLSAGDSNCDGSIDISDVVYLISYIFSGGPAPCASCP